MTDRMDFHLATCSCGQVRLRLDGPPIVASTCHCDSCKAAGRALEQLPGARPILDNTEGTAFVLFRKDRVSSEAGADLLADYRLTPESKTGRIVATCCNTAMFLDFPPGHWVSVYRGRLPERERGLDRRRGWFVPRLVLTWIGMGFRTPAIAFAKGETRVLAG